MEPFVSIIIPCFNEEKTIGALLENIHEQDYPGDRMEVFLIDGMSSDNTCRIIEAYASQHPEFRLLHNSGRFVSFALNLGIRQAKGEVIIRMDAHSTYPVNYIRQLVKYLYELDADNVGGVLETRPSGPSLKSNAIAVAMSSVFGVGDSHFRTGARDVIKVDTVPFGCFRKELFERIGMFDEELLRNQDDEFNARIIENGGLIYLIPDIRVTYFARDDIRSFLRTFYQYALFKPLVNRKLKKPASLRQFVPPLFVLFLLFGWIPVFISAAFLYIWLGGTGLYLLANLWFTARSINDTGRLGLLFYLPGIFFMQHLAYGLGYLNGILNFVLIRRNRSSIAASR